MCMPVLPKSRRPVHMAEAQAWRSIHDMRIALHLMSQADRTKILDAKPGVSISDMEAYLDDATQAMLKVVKAYYLLRESVRLWRMEDNKEGAGEYVI